MWELKSCLASADWSFESSPRGEWSCRVLDGLIGLVNILDWGVGFFFFLHFLHPLAIPAIVLTIIIESEKAMDVRGIATSSHPYRKETASLTGCIVITMTIRNTSTKIESSSISTTFLILSWKGRKIEVKIKLYLLREKLQQQRSKKERTTEEQGNLCKTRALLRTQYAWIGTEGKSNRHWEVWFAWSSSWVISNLKPELLGSP